MDSAKLASISAPFGPRLRDLSEALHSPSWSIALGDRTLLSAEALDIQGDEVVARLFRFVPGQGFVDSGDDYISKLRLPRLGDRPINLFTGAHFTCVGLVVNCTKDMLEFSEGVALGIRPEFVPDMAWSFLHQFAGAFSGWKQAVQWLGKSGTNFVLGQQVSVDAATEVSSVWEAHFGEPSLVCPVPPFGSWNPCDHIQMKGMVGDLSLVNLCQSQVNAAQTMSPPCQSWSKGGVGRGLESDNGMAFIDGLQLGLCCQPIAIFAECADEFASHPHASVVMQLAVTMGFKQVWNKIVPLHLLSPHTRSRWLAVWVRADIKAQLFDFAIVPSISPRPGWTDDAYRFHLPRTWLNQMILSDSEKTFYADAALLPPAKRRCLGPSPTPQQVLFGSAPC